MHSHQIKFCACQKSICVREKAGILEPGGHFYTSNYKPYGGTVCVPTLLCDQTASKFINSAAKIGQHEKLRVF